MTKKPHKKVKWKAKDYPAFLRFLERTKIELPESEKKLIKTMLGNEKTIETFMKFGSKNKPALLILHEFLKRR